MSSSLPSHPSLHTPAEIQNRFSARLRALRLRLGWKQATLAERSGVSLPTVRRFEGGGQITLANFLRLVHALGRLEELADAFEPPPIRSIDELEPAQAPRQRGHR